MWIKFRMWILLVLFGVTMKRTRIGLLVTAVAGIIASYGCGGGGGDGDPKHCAEGYPLWCSAINKCCAPDLNYACYHPSTGDFCAKGTCPVGSAPRDYCEKE